MFYLKEVVNHLSFLEVSHMMYPYMKLSDNTEIVHSELLEGNKVFVHFERPTENGFDSVRFELPSYDKVSWEGNYTEDELKSFVELLRHHAHLIYRYAAEGGVNIA